MLFIKKKKLCPTKLLNRGVGYVRLSDFCRVQFFLAGNHISFQHEWFAIQAINHLKTLFSLRGQINLLPAQVHSDSKSSEQHALHHKMLSDQLN